jgi:hypothetical protein
MAGIARAFDRHRASVQTFGQLPSRHQRVERIGNMACKGVKDRGGLVGLLCHDRAPSEFTP